MKLLETTDLIEDPKLYIVSSHKENLFLYPKIPENTLVQQGLEDATIERIVVYDNIDDALTGYGKTNLENTRLYLHIIDKDLVDCKHIKPKNLYDKTPLSDVLNMYWLLEPVSTKLIGVLNITDLDTVNKISLADKTHIKLYTWKYTKTGMVLNEVTQLNPSNHILEDLDITTKYKETLLEISELVNLL